MFGGLAERTVPLDRVRDHEPVGFAPELWEQLVAVGAPGMARARRRRRAPAPRCSTSRSRSRRSGRRLAPAPLIEHAVAARLLARVDALAAGGGRGRPHRHPRAAARPSTASPGSSLRARWPTTVVGVRRRRPRGARRRTRRRTYPTSRPRPSPTARLDGGSACSRPARSPTQLHAAGGRRVAACSPPPRWSGLGLGALEIGVRYVSEREQFGVPDRLVPGDPAHARRRERRARRRAAARPQGGVGADDCRPRPTPAELGAMAFLFAAEQAQRTSDRALHFHGGYGFMEEYDIQLFYRRAKGWANVLDEPAREYRAARRPPLRAGRGRARADVDFTPSPAAERFGDEVRALIAQRVHRRTSPARARHRHHARLGAAPGDGRPGLDRARRCPRRSAAAAAAPRSWRCCSASSSSRVRRTTA